VTNLKRKRGIYPLRWHAFFLAIALCEMMNKEGISRFQTRSDISKAKSTQKQVFQAEVHMHAMRASPEPQRGGGGVDWVRK